MFSLAQSLFMKDSRLQMLRHPAFKLFSLGIVLISTESESESRSVVSDSLPPHGLVHALLQARRLEWVAIPFSRGSSQPRSPALQADSLPAEPQGKPKLVQNNLLLFFMAVRGGDVARLRRHSVDPGFLSSPLTAAANSTH